jgi:coenzyme F420-reducing hydrogenase alpha subunit
MARVVVDPVTRIEGHLRIEAVVENGVITDAFSAGTMVRGLEKILIGRVMHGLSPSVSAAYVPPCMLSPVCAQWKMR